MPGLAQRIDQFSNGAASLYSFACTSGAVSANGFWSKHRGDISYNQLQKFWSDLSPQARQELLRIDKQTLFEQARKNMYCSRCNGLLLEGFMQIVMYGKSLQQEGAGSDSPCNRLGVANNENDGGLGMTGESQDEIQDPSVHPWGGLTTSRDGTLTLMDCYLYSKSLMVVQNVFDNARARERERELLYPDACGGGGRGWISQGMASYGRGHGPRETCALHTARLSCDTLVDFWSALGEETRQSLLRMKEEDFIERLMYRFDSKRFCRDCRRNVIREFKELKELKRMRKEPRCTSWFCVADTAFHYEVSEDTIQADWQQTFTDTIGTYHHFEWAVGTGEGKSDILEFENVGMNACVEVNGLDIAGLSACFITLRAWKLDGRCNEFSVKAHALKGQQCVHCRLVVGDGYVTITRGESIRRFFEHAEEAEEEEDDDSVDKDGNEVDGECSRPQKHAKSPELAREFLLDAATVIFKEQVEKAFREGTARQNAHSIFVCLALKLLEERVHVACKEIITLEKQMKLLEEEEKEKREEEKRRERRRAKEREKKLRRKERLKGKEKDTRDNKSSDLDQVSVVPDIDISKVEEILPSSVPDEEPSNYISFQNSVRESGDIHLSRPPSPDIQDELFTSSKNASLILQDYYHENLDGDVSNGDYLLTLENLKFPHRKVKLRKEFQVDPSVKWTDKRRFAVVSESGATATKAEPRFQNDNFENISRGVTESSRQFRITPSKSGRNFTSKFNEKSYCFNRRYDSHSCSCNNQQNEYRAKLESVNKLGCEIRSVSKSESGIDVSKPFYRVNKYNNQNQTDRPKSKTITSYCTKKVWEPMESSQKKHPRSNSDSDIILSSSTSEEFEPGLQNPLNSVEINHKDTGKNNLKESSNDGPLVPIMSTLSSSSSSSDNGSSCLSEGDSNLASSLNPPNPYSISTLDFENSSQQSEGKETSVCPEVGIEEKQKINGGEALESKKINVPGNSPTNPAENLENGKSTLCINTMHQGTTTPMHNNNNNNNNNDNNKSNSNNQNLHLPMFQPPYYHQNPVSWPSAPASGLVPFPYPSHYLFSNPLGYGLNGNSRFCMQYGSSLPYLPSSLHNPSKIQVYPQVVKATGTNSKEQHKESLDEANKEGGETGKSSSKVHKENPDFSLFHFGGPVAVATGNKSNPVCSKEGIGKDICSNLSADHCDGDPACYNKAEATIEEYNLFTGIRFSIF